MPAGLPEESGSRGANGERRWMVRSGCHGKAERLKASRAARRERRSRLVGEELRDNFTEE